MDSAAAARLLDYSRWLVDRQVTRLSSIESRGAMIVGWGGTQVTVTAGALALLQQVAQGGVRQVGAVLLALGGLFAAVAVSIAVWGVLRVRHNTPAPETDLTELVAWLKGSTATDAEAQILDRLIGALNEPGDKPRAVLPSLAGNVDERGKNLRYASWCLGVAVVFDGVAVVALAAKLVG